MGARRLAVAGVCTLGCLLSFASAPALAAAPEAPAPVGVEALKGTSVTFLGELNPGKEGGPGTYEVGTYEFLYRQSATECEGGARAPEAPGIALGGGQEVLPPVEVGGLLPDTQYTVCLLARNGIKGEETVGPPVTFKTALPPEEPKTEPVNGITAMSATLNGVLNPGGEGEAGTYEFLYRQSATECQGGQASGGEALGHKEEAVSAAVSGLLPNRQYTVCVLARNNAGETALGQPVTFKTLLAPPAVAEAWVTDVASGSATLNAQINPEGTETTYRFEYGTSEAYGSSIPLAAAGVGSGTSPLTVQAQPQDLRSGTTYHFRVIASSTGGTEHSADRTFTTQGVGGELSLPDGRQWELVSPPNKHGASLQPWSIIGGLIQTAANGSGIAYLANGPVTSEPTGNRSAESSQVLSRRVAGGWATQDIATPHDARSKTLAGHNGEYQLFSSDLSRGVVEPRGFTLLSPEATERTPYLRDDETGAYRPLVTAANVAPGVKFGGPVSHGFGEVQFEGGTPDMSHVMLSSIVPLTASASAKGIRKGLYEWSEGKLQLVSVLPGPGEEPVPGEFAGARNAISVDGSRIVWGGAGHLYLRDVRKGETVTLDAAQGGPEEGGGGFQRGPEETEEGEGQLQAESSDGSKVFFVDQRRLTSGATAGDLYECEIVEAAGKLACDLSDLTVPETPGEDAGVRLVVGASNDGSYVYFIADGVLAEGAEGGQNNLYVHHDGTTALVATLASEDVLEFLSFGGAPLLFELSMRVSSNGRFVAFMSDRSLTGYDNRDAVSREPDEEVYLYSAESKRLTCASCNPTGERPVGLFYTGETSYPLIDQAGIWRERWLAGGVPGWTKRKLGPNLVFYQPRYLSDSGQLFFDSSDALVSQDINGLVDVYEYEPTGAGGCRDASGCVGLISSGASNEESVFLGASESGDDVFFLTASQLVEGDKDHALDVYDAHVCGGEGVPCPGVVAPPPVCSTADSCRGAVSSQPGVFGASGSATFSGAGNPTPPTATSTVKETKKSKAKRNRKHRKRIGRRRRRHAGKPVGHVKRSLSARTGR